MLDMTGGAVSDVRVKGGRLPLQKIFVICVASDTFRFVNTSYSRVAGGAIGFKLRVSRRQLARNYLALPTADAVAARIPERGETQRQHR